MSNTNVFDIILLATSAFCLMKLINTFEVKKIFSILFNIKDNNKLPVDYGRVHSLLDGHIKRIAKKHHIELTFKINKDLINSCFGECEVYFFGKNGNHEFSFNFFNKIKNTKKKMPDDILTNLAQHAASDLEDKLLNFLISDKLASLLAD